MKRIPFNAAMRASVIQVEAWETKTPGLVVHGRVRPDKSIAKRGKWVISHVRSGYSLERATFPNRPAAIAVANLLGKGIDWTREGKDLQHDPRAKSAVEAAYKVALSR